MKIFISSTIMVLFAMFKHSSAQQQTANVEPPRFTVIDKNDGTQCIEYAPANNEVSTLGYQLRIRKPDGSFHDDDTTDLVFCVTDLGDEAKDGVYTYEIRYKGVWTGPDNVDERDRGTTGSDQEPYPTIVGVFTIIGGSVVDPSDSEDDPTRRLLTERLPQSHTGEGGTVNNFLPTTRKLDEVIHGDLIVNGSACIGFDCKEDENFGFDTLRLKENNLRINFFDTSTIKNFPSNDWTIKINDSNDGGADFFAIEDATSFKTPFFIKAGAPSASLVVDDYGSGSKFYFGANFTMLCEENDSVPLTKTFVLLSRYWHGYNDPGSETSLG